MGFPTQLPNQAIQALLGPLLGQGSFGDGRFALGAYEVAGYGLFNVYGDIQYLMQESNPAHLANVMAHAPEEVQKFMDFANAHGDGLMNAEELPPWMIPFIQQLAAWTMKKIFERLSRQENPQLFGVTLKNENRRLPQETGGAFPERTLGVPSSTGAFTKGTKLQESVPQAQPSEQVQQPTGPMATQHPAVPTSSKSPQSQGNTANPAVQKPN